MPVDLNFIGNHCHHLSFDFPDMYAKDIFSLFYLSQQYALVSLFHAQMGTLGHIYDLPAFSHLVMVYDA